ncbi:MAG: hypothetical protein AB7J13_03170, partial [Pyrinomonadaceae bacterium]
MFKLPINTTNIIDDDDILSSYRERIWFLFGIVFVVIFLPASIVIYLDGFTTLAAAVACMFGVFAINRSSLRDKAPQLTLAAFVAALMLVIGLSLI